MRITHLKEEPIHHLPCVNVAPGGRSIRHTSIPILHAYADALPPELDALVFASDLQCFDTNHLPPNQRTLMGHRVVEGLAELAAANVLPDTLRTGIVFAGDLYAIPTLDKRGGLGDVHQVWDHARSEFLWVAGVGGNHDLFHGKPSLNSLQAWSSCHPLDDKVVQASGVSLAGISGVIGNNGKAWRITEKDWKREAKRIFSQSPDVLILHEGPCAEDAGLPGHPMVADALNNLASSTAQTPLVVCGHAHWKTPLATLQSGLQVLNVDFRCVVLTRAST